MTQEPRLKPETQLAEIVCTNDNCRYSGDYTQCYLYSFDRCSFYHAYSKLRLVTKPQEERR